MNDSIEYGHVSDANFITMNRIRHNGCLEQKDVAAAIANNVSWWKDTKSTTRDPKKKAHAELDDFSPRASWWPNVRGNNPIFFPPSLSVTHTTTKIDEWGLTESNTMSHERMFYLTNSNLITQVALPCVTWTMSSTRAIVLVWRTNPFIGFASSTGRSTHTAMDQSGWKCDSSSSCLRDLARGRSSVSIP